MERLFEELTLGTAKLANEGYEVVATKEGQSNQGNGKSTGRRLRTMSR